MKPLNKLRIALVLVLNITIAIVYYLDNLNANYSELSSDIQNIIPVAQKFDNPNLFQDDLYVNNLNNVKYYTPFYVQTLRCIAKFTDYNYVQAINVLGLICHLLFGILWFFLLYKFVNNYWVAFFISIILRGVIWLPGLEIWGISDLWTIMPRTVYISLMPIPFLLISQQFIKLLFGGVLIGLIFNFHPITGLGGILMFVTLVVLLLYYYPKLRERFSVPKLLCLILAIGLGISPFIITYFGKTSVAVTYDLNAFNEAFNARIPEYFKNPWLFLKQWFGFKTLFYIIPLLLYVLIAFKERGIGKNAKLLLVLTLILIVIPSLAIPLERLVNGVFNTNLRMSFQLIRMQKVAIIPCVFALVFVLDYVFSKIKTPHILPAVVFVYVCILVFSKSEMLNNVPFFGDDISKSILPRSLSAFAPEDRKPLAIDKMAKYIKAHTKTTDVICGSHVLRGATKRSIIFDGKGASMLIEGNPKRFTQWQKRQKTINNFTTIDEVISYLRYFNADYFVTTSTIPQCELVHSEGKLKLYKL
jgi:hypothetical protein